MTKTISRVVEACATWSKRTSISLVCALLLIGTATGCRKVADVGAVREKAALSGKKGARWLKTQQQDDGSFEQAEYIKVGITSLAAMSGK